jgi:hypothetical protein
VSDGAFALIQSILCCEARGLFLSFAAKVGIRWSVPHDREYNSCAAILRRRVAQALSFVCLSLTNKARVPHPLLRSSGFVFEFRGKGWDSMACPARPGIQFMRRNPVTRGLVESPELWRWSSYRYYAVGEEGPVKIGD